MFPLLAYSHSTYVETLFGVLGKGRQHAGLFYEHIMRTGAPPPRDHPAFQTAQGIYSKLLELTDLRMPTLVEERSDGNTGKFLLRTEDHLEIEAVLIPMQSGGTLCISSQVGCQMGCTFCETGRMGLLRNLRTEEILSQVFTARHRLSFQFTNVVFMGMGEPFDNFDSVMRAAEILIDQKGFGCGKKNVTVSTSGRADEIRRLATLQGDTPNLAVSINAPSDLLRNKLMPINRKFPLQELYQAMREYNQMTGRQILAAYVLIKDFNDSVAHAAELAAYLRGLDVKINLIPYNPQSKDRYQPPANETVDAFLNFLRGEGYQTLLRVTKGRKIMAGCGQLGNLELRRKKLALL